MSSDSRKPVWPSLCQRKLAIQDTTSIMRPMRETSKIETTDLNRIYLPNPTSVLEPPFGVIAYDVLYPRRFDGHYFSKSNTFLYSTAWSHQKEAILHCHSFI